MGLNNTNSPDSPVPNYAGEDLMNLPQNPNTAMDAPGGFTAEDIARFAAESARSFRRVWEKRDAEVAA